MYVFWFSDIICINLRPVLRNKFAHTLTLFFLCTYVDQWPTFFLDLFALIRPAESTSQSTFNKHVSLLFFHIVLEISGEVADQLIKAARHHLPARHARDGRVRDAVRERDAGRINEAVLTIVADGSERMARLRKGDLPASDEELDGAIEVVDWGVRTFASYAGTSPLAQMPIYCDVNSIQRRLDRHQPDCHAYNCSAPFHTTVRSFPCHPPRDLLRAYQNRRKGSQRARGQAAAHQGIVPGTGPRCA